MRGFEAQGAVSSGGGRLRLHWAFLTDKVERTALKPGGW